MASLKSATFTTKKSWSGPAGVILSILVSLFLKEMRRTLREKKKSVGPAKIERKQRQHLLRHQITLALTYRGDNLFMIGLFSYELKKLINSIIVVISEIERRLRSREDEDEDEDEEERRLFLLFLSRLLTRQVTTDRLTY